MAVAANSGSERGRILTAVGLLCLLAAVTLWVVGGAHQARVNALRAKGHVTMATVIGKHIVEEPYTDNKGRRKTRTQNMIEFRYDMGADTLYSAWVGSGRPAPSPDKGALMITSERRSTGEEYEHARPGQHVAIVFNPSEPFTIETAQFVREYDTFWTNIAGGVCLVIGIGCFAPFLLALKNRLTG